MNKKLIKILTNYLSLNINFFLFFLYNIIGLVNNLAAFLLNIYLVFELNSRIVTLFFFVKNILYFLFLNQKKHVLEKNDNNFHTNLNIFNKILLIPYNYPFLCNLIEYFHMSYGEMLAYLPYKLDIIEKIYMLISSIFEYEKQTLYLKTIKQTLIKEYAEEIKLQNFAKLSLISTYSFSTKYKKLAYIYANNLFNFLNPIQFNFAEFFNIRIGELTVTDLYDFMNLKLSQRILPIVYSVFIGYYKSVVFSIFYFYNVFLVLQSEYILVEYNLLNIYLKSKKSKLNYKYSDFSFGKLDIFFNFYLFVMKYIVHFIKKCTELWNDAVCIIYKRDLNIYFVQIVIIFNYLNFDYSDSKFYSDINSNVVSNHLNNKHSNPFTRVLDFTYSDLFDYYYFKNKLHELEYTNLFYCEEIFNNYIYIKEEIKFVYLSFYFYRLFLFNYLFLFFFHISYLVWFIWFCFINFRKFILSLIIYSNLYLYFILELHEAAVYFLETFYYFITLSFYSEHVFTVLFIEFLLELFGLNMNSIEFVISLIFIIASSIAASEFLDFLESYNLEITLNTFSFFFVCFTSIYEEQKILISYLILKIKSYAIIKYILKISLKFYEKSKKNLKISVLIEKIKKIKKK